MASVGVTATVSFSGLLLLGSLDTATVGFEPPRSVSILDKDLAVEAAYSFLILVDLLADRDGRIRVGKARFFILVRFIVVVAFAVDAGWLFGESFALRVGDTPEAGVAVCAHPCPAYMVAYVRGSYPVQFHAAVLEEEKKK